MFQVLGCALYHKRYFFHFLKQCFEISRMLPFKRRKSEARGICGLMRSYLGSGAQMVQELSASPRDGAITSATLALQMRKLSSREEPVSNSEAGAWKATPLSEPGLWQAFAQQCIKLWVLPDPSESVTRACPCTQVIFHECFWDSQTR